MRLGDWEFSGFFVLVVYVMFCVVGYYWEPLYRYCPSSFVYRLSTVREMKANVYLSS